jgi:hypothetical protein
MDQQKEIINKKKRWYKKWWGIIIIIILGPPTLFMVLGMMYGLISAVVNVSNEKKNPTTTQSTQNKTESQPAATSQKNRDPDELNIAVSHDGVNLVFVSSEAKDLGNCKFTLNNEYKYAIPSQYFLNAGETKKLGFNNFTLSDGTRFNAYFTKPKYLNVWCDRKDGDNGVADIFWD